jgi:hypothetical protein
MSCGQNAEQNLISKIAHKSFKSIANFKFLETIITNQTRFHEEIKCTLNSKGKHTAINSRLFCPGLISKYGEVYGTTETVILSCLYGFVTG